MHLDVKWCLVIHTVIAGLPGMMVVGDKSDQIVKYPVQYLYSVQPVEDKLYHINGECIVLD